MERALERIERMREIADLPLATDWILDNSTIYLDISEAAIWLNEGMVNETAHNLTQANKLISLAHSTLQKRAVELKTKRVESYIKVVENLQNKLADK